MSIFVLLRRAVAAHASLVFSFAALVVVAGEARAIPSTVIPNESIFIFDGTTLSGPPPHAKLGDILRQRHRPASASGILQ